MADKTSIMRGPKAVSSKTRSVTTAMTAATALCTLPKGSRILALILNGTASNAGTTATLSVGTSTTANELVNAANVLAAGVGNGSTVLNGVAGALGSVYTSDTVIYAKYAETGTGSSAGGWKLTVVYTTGNITDDETI